MNDSTQSIRIEVSDTNETQETLGPRTAAKRVLDLGVDTLVDQLKEHVVPLVRSLESASGSRSGSMAVRTVRVRVGVSAEGKLFIATGVLSTGIEVEFGIT